MGRKFDEEFRQEAVRLVLEGGVPAARAARDLGVSQTTLSKWLTAARSVKGESLSETEREELKRLRKENVQLKMERDILKKATAYFAKNSQ
jgi:transposase